MPNLMDAAVDAVERVARLHERLSHDERAWAETEHLGLRLMLLERALAHARGAIGRGDVLALLYWHAVLDGVVDAR